MIDIEQKNAEPAIVVDNVDMVFNIANEQLNSLKEYFIKAAKKELFFREFKALENISFTVNKGDVYGIVGTNGSGKSTLLKIIAGVLEPSSGSCKVSGSIAPLIELGAGFDPELTARENVYLNGALLGYKKEFIDENFDSIIEFAEVESFVDMPLKNYSSGMTARIAFAIATATTPDILVVDEALSVGDVFFQEKCERRINDLIEEKNTTVLFVSHSIGQVERLCDRAIWIERGHKVMEGSVSKVCGAYRNLAYAEYLTNSGLLSKDYISPECFDSPFDVQTFFSVLSMCLPFELRTEANEKTTGASEVTIELLSEAIFRIASVKRPKTLLANADNSSCGTPQEWCVSQGLLSSSLKKDCAVSRIVAAKAFTLLYRKLLRYHDDIKPIDPFAVRGTYDYVTDNELMAGFSSESFGPNDSATRGQVALVIWRSLGKPVAKRTTSCQDVDPDSHHATAIAWAVENNLIPAPKTDMFLPDAPISKDDFSRAAEALAEYTKLDEIAAEDVQHLKDNANMVTRAKLAELATIIHEATQIAGSNECDSSTA